MKVKYSENINAGDDISAFTLLATCVILYGISKFISAVLSLYTRMRLQHSILGDLSIAFWLKMPALYRNDQTTRTPWPEPLHTSVSYSPCALKR